MHFCLYSQTSRQGSCHLLSYFLATSHFSTKMTSPYYHYLHFDGTAFFKDINISNIKYYGLLSAFSLLKLTAQLDLYGHSLLLKALVP